MSATGLPDLPLVNNLFDIPIDFFNLLDNIAIGVVVLDLERRIVGMNQALKTLTGFNGQDYVGVSCANKPQDLKDAIAIISAKYPDEDPLVIEILKNHQGLILMAKLRDKKEDKKEVENVQSRSESAEQLHMRALWEEVPNDPPLSSEEEARRQTDSM